MAKSAHLLQQLTLAGLSIAPAQTWGNVRLVPVVRRGAPGDLRLAKRAYEEPVSVVSLDGGLMDGGVKYVSYIPHGLVLSWNSDGSPVAALGTKLAPASDGKAIRAMCGAGVRVLHRMVKREEGRTLRFLPLHLAMEGYLALHFNGPDIAWTEYSRRAISRGLDPRSETSIHGAALPGFGEALRVFEIHEGQVGVLVFIADAFASAFVVPHPEDYRALHLSLLEDFYGELLYRYGMLYPDVGRAEASVDDRAVSSLADLRREVARMRGDWSDFAEMLASSVVGREVRSSEVYRLQPFSLQRFSTGFDRQDEAHIGEAIVRADGTIEYLKTFRLSAAQARRAHLLSELDRYGWNIERAAAGIGITYNELVRRIGRAGFSYLLKPHVLLAAKAREVAGGRVG
jgi:hypothetical protein